MKVFCWKAVVFSFEWAFESDPTRDTMVVLKIRKMNFRAKKRGKEEEIARRYFSFDWQRKRKANMQTNQTHTRENLHFRFAGQLLARRTIINFCIRSE